MKHILLSGLLFLLSFPQVLAFEVFIPKSIPQGETLQIQVYNNTNLSSVEGNAGSQNILFFPESITPADDTNITRGEFLYLLFNNSALPRSGMDTQYPFPDVTIHHTFASSIYSAKSLALVHGYDDGNFHSEDSLTRAQTAKILTEAFNIEASQEVDSFTDLTKEHSLHTYMDRAIAAGLFKGYGDGTVKPDRALRYDEAETLLKRVTQKTTLTERPTMSLFKGYVGFHRINDIGDKTIQITTVDIHGSKTTIDYPITITKQKYPTTSFNLPPSKTDLFAKEAYNKTWSMIDGAKKTTLPTQLWKGEFIVPTDGEISMGFGDTVYINGALSGSHFGIDYANKTGTPVFASNGGVVVLSGYTPSYGNTVIIDHGQNVFTMYMHMSELKATKDQAVQKGQLVGLIGATGIATGPHLHFTHFIGNVIVDSQPWFEGKF